MRQEPPSPVIEIIELLRKLPKVGNTIMFVDGTVTIISTVQNIGILSYTDGINYGINGIGDNRHLFVDGNGNWFIEDDTGERQKIEAFWDIDWNFGRSLIVPC